MFLFCLALVIDAKGENLEGMDGHLAAASEMLKPYDANATRCYPVSARVNSVANHVGLLMEPLWLLCMIYVTYFCWTCGAVASRLFSIPVLLRASRSFRTTGAGWPMRPMSLDDLKYMFAPFRDREASR